MGFFTRRSKAQSFWSEEAPAVEGWVSVALSRHAAFLEQHEAGEDILSTVGQALLFNRFITDYWATVLVGNDQEFSRSAPGGALHTAVKDTCNDNASAVVALLARTDGPGDLFRRIDPEHREHMFVRAGPLVCAAFSLGPEYSTFLFFEYAMAMIKSSAIQRAVKRRLEGTDPGSWKKEEILELSRGMDTHGILRLNALKPSKMWDEIELSVRIEE